MKKIISILTVLLMLLSLMACGTKTVKNNKINIVCTVFSIYDWVREIAGENANINWLLDNGTDMHSFEPTAADMIAIAECDIMIYIGGTSEEWTNETVKQYENKNRTVINLMELLGENTLCAEHTEEHHHHHHDEADEHIWLSLKNAVIFTEYITNVLVSKDPKNAVIYKSNNKAYVESLNQLDKQYQELVNNTDIKTLVVADRFPFRYLTNDYGINHYAAFPGCSAETEASFETIAFLSKKTDALGLNYIITTETANKKIAETVIDNTKDKNIKILTLDSMQSVNKKSIKDGISYLKLAEKNLETLKKALLRKEKNETNYG